MLHNGYGFARLFFTDKTTKLNYMKSAKEYWKERFGEYPQNDADRLAVVMMVEYYHDITKDEVVKNNLVKPDVMQRSEQLIDFLRWLKPIPEDKVLNTDEKELVQEYLKSINCA